MAGGDVRAFYEALGIELPGWAHTEAPVRCFVDPDAHEHQDRDASCSVNLQSGAFNCHGCGARGGAYDAALARGRSPRQAIDLMVAYGLTHRRQLDCQPLVSPASTLDASRSRVRRASPAPATALSPAVTPERVRAWAERLQRSTALLDRIERERGWRRRTLAGLEIGFDGERITVPIWRALSSVDRGSGRVVLQGVLRLRVDRVQHPKVTAVPGTRLGLLPPPGSTRERLVVLVEGPSDMLAARSAGLPAIAVPGANAWRPEWARSLDGRSVVVVMDCDRAGRQAAVRIAVDLKRRGITAGIFDLAPSRQDGYDISDWLRDGNPATRLLQPPQARAASAFTRLTRLPTPSGSTQRAGSMPVADPLVTAARRSVGCRPF